MSYFKKFLADAEANGRSLEDAINSPEAKAAAKRDDEAARSHQLSRSKNEYLIAFAKGRAADGMPHQDGFIDQEEMLAAMNDPAYDKNPAYREAVEEIMRNTPAEVIGVSATATSADGTKVQLGQPYSTEKATVESMMENAYRDMLFETLAQIDLTTATGRYQYMQYLTDPRNKELLDYQESLVTSDTQRTHEAMMVSQAAGHIDRASTSMGDEPIDVPQDNFGVKGDHE